MIHCLSILSGYFRRKQYHSFTGLLMILRLPAPSPSRLRRATSPKGRGKRIGGAVSPSGLTERAKRQQFITVILILLLPRRDLGGEAGGQVIAEGVETVEGSNDALLCF